jgi:predicted RNase H-like HicB family nuclease
MISSARSPGAKPRRKILKQDSSRSENYERTSGYRRDPAVNSAPGRIARPENLCGRQTAERRALRVRHDVSQEGRDARAPVRPIRRYAVVIEKVQGSNYSACVPDLPGCVATGDMLDEIKQLMQYGIEFHLEGMREDGLPIPEPVTEVAYDEVACSVISPAPRD